MLQQAAEVGPPSLLGISVRRSITLGRVYLLVGAGLSIFYSAVFALAAGPSFVTVFPVLLPVIAVMGGLGGMVVFTNDRLKGVFEYLIAYGLTPLRLFANILLASLVLESIVLGAGCLVGLGIYAATGHALSWALGTALGLYTIPMSYASVAFTATVGMVWTSLSSPRAGMNSPIGLLPIVGVTPALVTLVAALAAVATRAVPARLVTTVAILLLVVVVFGLLRLVARRLPPERLLSPT